MWGLSKIERILGAVVGAVLGAMAGALFVLTGENKVPSSISWYDWAVFMPPAAILGLVFSLIGGVKSIFGFR